jgi:hypothetical protein
MICGHEVSGRSKQRYNLVNGEDGTYLCTPCYGSSGPILPGLYECLFTLLKHLEALTKSASLLSDSDPCTLPRVLQAYATQKKLHVLLAGHLLYCHFSSFVGLDVISTHLATYLAVLIISISKLLGDMISE